MCVQVCARKWGRFETILCRNRVKTTKHLARCSLYLKQMTTSTSQVIYFYVTGDGNGPTYWSVARRNPHLKQGWLKLHGFTTVWSTTEEKHSLTEVHPRRIQISVWSVPFISRSHTHTHIHWISKPHVPLLDYYSGKSAKHTSAKEWEQRLWYLQQACTTH